jgi:3-oxoacyl-[acyl-carrier-protein] synthase-3
MGNKAAILGIEYHLPSSRLTNTDLATQFPEWPVEKIETKTGIVERRIAANDECASDLAVEAAKRLFASGVCAPGDIDYILFCTQSPDYFLPTSACLIQDRLGVPQTAGALDFNLGCSGYIYGLGLAQGLIETGQASRVLLLMGDTYSKHINPGDKSVRTIFGDAAAATLVAAVPGDSSWIGPHVVGTDGSGAENLIVPAGGMRLRRSPETAVAVSDESGNERSKDDLFMNGGEIFSFTLRVVGKAVEKLLAKAGLAMDDIDLFVFHQANRYMLDHLRKRLNIPQERFYIAMSHCGNTVSSTIPIALQHARQDGLLSKGKRVMLVGFGVGYSWGATLVRWYC